MTSMPASRSARAMIFAPRSWPSRPGLATTTRILREFTRRRLAGATSRCGPPAGRARARCAGAGSRRARGSPGRARPAPPTSSPVDGSEGPLSACEPVPVVPPVEPVSPPLVSPTAARRRGHDRDRPLHERVRRADVAERPRLGERVRAAAALAQDARVEAAVVGRGRVRRSGRLFDQVTVSPTLTVTPLGENLKSLIVTPVEAAASATGLSFCLASWPGSSSRSAGSAAGAAGARGRGRGGGRGRRGRGLGRRRGRGRRSGRRRRLRGRRLGGRCGRRRRRRPPARVVAPASAAPRRPTAARRSPARRPRRRAR